MLKLLPYKRILNVQSRSNYVGTLPQKTITTKWTILYVFLWHLWLALKRAG